MNKNLIIGAIVLIAAAGVLFATRKPGTGTQIVPTPTPVAVEQLPVDKQPKVSLSFSQDGHYVTVNITRIAAAKLEYNLIYDATVKKTQINTGVSGGTALNGSSEYSYRQLLGSESSGKFTYHESIKNAVMELTLRNQDGYSVFSATYPFEFKPGKSVDLTPSQ